MSDFDLPITMLSPSRHRRAVAQLVNQVRATHGLPPLRFAMSLRVSARAWAVTQTRNSSFGHGSWSERVLRFPFVLAGRPRTRAVGENLAWATGPFTTPRAIVLAWMSSQSHRDNMLRNWQYAAVWSTTDSPQPGHQADGVTVVHHFGRRIS